MIPPTDLDGEGQSAQKLKNNNEADLEKNEADGGDQDQWKIKRNFLNLANDLYSWLS